MIIPVTAAGLVGGGIPPQPLGLSSSLLSVSGVNASYTQQTVDLSIYAGHQIKLVWKWTIDGVNNDDFDNDVQIDNISIDGNTYDFESGTESFEGATSGTVNSAYGSTTFAAIATNPANGEWGRFTGTTASANTGNLGAQSGSYFVYCETSGSIIPAGGHSWLRSPTITLSAAPGSVSFYEGRELDISAPNAQLDFYVDVIAQP